MNISSHISTNYLLLPRLLESDPLASDYLSNVDPGLDDLMRQAKAVNLLRKNLMHLLVVLLRGDNVLSF